MLKWGSIHFMNLKQWHDANYMTQEQSLCYSQTVKFAGWKSLSKFKIFTLLVYFPIRCVLSWVFTCMHLITPLFCYLIGEICGKIKALPHLFFLNSFCLFPYVDVHWAWYKGDSVYAHISVKVSFLLHNVARLRWGMWLRTCR